MYLERKLFQSNEYGRMDVEQNTFWEPYNYNSTGSWENLWTPLATAVFPSTVPRKMNLGRYRRQGPIPQPITSISVGFRDPFAADDNRPNPNGQRWNQQQRVRVPRTWTRQWVKDIVPDVERKFVRIGGKKINKNLRLTVSWRSVIFANIFSFKI
jgi:hypothetical protein